MRILKIAAALLAAGALMTACSKESGALKPVKTTEAQLDKLAEQLRMENHVEKGGAAVDVAGVIAALPKAVSVTYASSALDAASGATVLKSVKITPAGQPALGVAIDEVKLWGFDAEFAKARLSGQRLTEAKKLASRIEADNISVFGLEALLGPITDTETQVIQGAVGSNDPQIAAALKVQPLKYDISVARMVYDDVQLRPFELVPAKLSADSPFAQAMPYLQGYAAVARTLAFDSAAMFGTKGEIAFTQAGSSSSALIGIESIAYRGWRGFDVDLGLIRNMTYAMKMAPAPTAAGSPATAVPIPTMDISETVAKTSMADMRLDKLMGFLARGQMPARTETDLLSFGVLSFEKMNIALSGKPLYTLGKTTLDLSHWHWLVPNAGRLQVDDMSFDVKGFIDFANSVGRETTYDAPPLIPADPKIMAVVSKYGLDKPSLDFALGWNWDPKAGGASADFAFGLDGYDRFDVKGDVILPGFDAISALIPEKGPPNEKAIQDLLAKTFRYKSITANLVDEGGLDKGFAMAAELLPYLPTDEPALATFKNMNATQLRGMASNGAYLMADTAAQQFPPAKDLLRPFAAWVTQGGKVHFKSEPKTPLTAAELEAAGNNKDVVTIMGASVTHEPPPGTAAAKPKS